MELLDCLMCAAVAISATACRYHFDPLVDRDEPDAELCGHTFCDNFDRPGPVEARWDSADTSGGQFSLATDDSVTPPGSFLLELPLNMQHGFLLKLFPGATASAQLSLDVAYASATPGTAEIDLVHLKWQPPPAPCTEFGYYLVRDGTGPFDLQETYGTCGGNENTLFDMNDNTGFHHVDMFVTFGAIGAARVRLDIDGVTRVDKMTSHAIEPAELVLEIGGGAVRNLVSPWQIRYDDVIVDVQ